MILNAILKSAVTARSNSVSNVMTATEIQMIAVIMNVFLSPVGMAKDKAKNSVMMVTTSTQTLVPTIADFQFAEMVLSSLERNVMMATLILKMNVMNNACMLSAET